MDGRFDRQLGLVRMSELQKLGVTVIGVGGIGSALVPQLAQMGIANISVYDNDVLEIHNISNQNYPHTAVGKKKVDAMRDHVNYMTGIEIETFDKRFENGDPLKGIVVFAVDNMESRINVFKHIRSFRPEVNYVIDSRMAKLQCEVHVLPFSNTEICDRYEKFHLYGDEDVAPVPCTEKAIIFNTSGVASFISSAIVKIANGTDFATTGGHSAIFDYVTMRVRNG